MHFFPSDCVTGCFGRVPERKQDRMAEYRKNRSRRKSTGTPRDKPLHRFVWRSSQRGEDFPMNCYRKLLNGQALLTYTPRLNRLQPMFQPYHQPLRNKLKLHHRS